jgi:hypothetical protein
MIGVYLSRQVDSVRIISIVIVQDHRNTLAVVAQRTVEEQTVLKGQYSACNIIPASGYVR